MRCLVPLTRSLARLWQHPSSLGTDDLQKQERVQAGEGCSFHLEGPEQNATVPLHCCQSGLRYTAWEKASCLLRRTERKRERAK